MADPYSQALNIAAPFTRLGSQMFQGQALYEQGRAKSALQESQRSALESHSGLYNAQAQKAQEEAAGLAQRRQYQTPEFASQIAATLNGFSPEQGTELASGNAPWATPEQVQSFNRGRGAHLAQLGATGDTNGEQMIKAFGELLGQGRTDQAISNPAQAGNIAQGVAAGGGKPLVNNLGGNGVFNQFTGGQTLNAVGNSAVMENRAQANNANASAGHQSASAALARSKIGETQTITNPDGTQTVVTSGKAPKAPTEFQGKSATYGARAQEAHDIMNELEADTGAGAYSRLASSTLAGNGLLNTIANPSFSESTQRAVQARRDFINAVLRQESGAAIAPTEFDNANKQYFPQPGDNKKTIEQKARNRETAILGFKNSAGPAAFVAPPLDKPPGQDKATLLRDAKDAIARGANRAEVIKELKRFGVDGGSI